MKSYRHSKYSNVLAYVNLKIPVYYMLSKNDRLDILYIMYQKNFRNVMNAECQYVAMNWIM